jgi:hypothetical protein
MHSAGGTVHILNSMHAPEHRREIVDFETCVPRSTVTRRTI